jgi:hypothetical protein
MRRQEVPREATRKPRKRRADGPVVIVAVAGAVIAVIQVKELRYSVTSGALRHRP